MDAIDNRTDSGLRAEAANATEVHSNSALEQTDPDLQIAENDANDVLENLQQEPQQGVHAAQPILNSQAPAGSGAEWDAWKIMVIKRS